MGSKHVEKLSLFRKESAIKLGSLLVGDMVKRVHLDDQGDMDEPTMVIEEASKPEPLGSLTCSTCQLKFPDLVDQRSHFKTDWHRYNLKMKLNDLGGDPISEEKFNEIIDGIASSISGSEDEDDLKDDGESDSEEEESCPVTKGVQRIDLTQDKVRDSTSRTPRGNPLVATPKFFYENTGNGQIFALYKCLMPIRVNAEDDEKGVESPLVGSNLCNYLRSGLKSIAVIMTSGGHFAGAIFDGDQIILHKTFHSYTVRAKQGGGQSSKDNKSGFAKSAGASLRRYNENSFAQHISDLISKPPWSEKLRECGLIFIRAIGSNQAILFGSKNKNPPLFHRKSDSRIRGIPFQTKRPTFNEIKRVHAELTTLFSYGISKEELLNNKKSSGKGGEKVEDDGSVNGSGSSPVRKKKNKKKVGNMDRGRSRSPKERPDPIGDDLGLEDEDSGGEGEYDLVGEVVEIDTRDELQEMDDSIRRKKKKKVRSKEEVEPPIEPSGIVGEIFGLLTNLEPSGEPHETLEASLVLKLKEMDGNNPENDLNQIVDRSNSTLLHFAANYNLLNLLWALMEKGCSPSLKNKLGKYPYNCATTKECRVIFRRFMAEFPQHFDYTKSQIPGPLTEDLEKEMAEKKKLLNKLKRDKEKAKKAEKKAKEEEENEQKRFLGMSDREKRALAAERRILSKCERESAQKPILVRCFECAKDISGKVPFSYAENTFCSPGCLTTHRKKCPVPLSV